MDEKKQRLAQLKLEKERLEAELARAEEEANAEDSVPAKPRPAAPTARAAVATKPAPRRPAARATTQATAKSPAPEAAGMAAAAVAAPATKQAAPQASAEPEDDERDADDQRQRYLYAYLRNMPAWLVSLVVHLIGLIVLSFMTFVSVQDTQRLFVLANPTGEEEPLEEFNDLKVEQMEELVVNELNPNASSLEVGDIAIGDIPTDAGAFESNISDVALDSSVFTEIGSLFDKDGTGMQTIGEQFKGAARFFGAQTSGTHFVFVVDNSNSMTKGRFETALHELVKSVEGMGPNQYFYVLFFSDTAYPLFHPRPATRMVPATVENKDRLRSWLSTVQMCLKTKGEKAVSMALALKPDGIYILGDGRFTDKAAKILTAPHNRRVTIHTLGMEVDEVGRRELQAIAQANNGTFRAVAANPIARDLAKRNPIRRNNVRGPVWGIDLPANAPPKKNPKKKK